MEANAVRIAAAHARTLEGPFGRDADRQRLRKLEYAHEKTAMKLYTEMTKRQEDDDALKSRVLDLFGAAHAAASSTTTDIIERMTKDMDKIKTNVAGDLRTLGAALASRLDREVQKLTSRMDSTDEVADTRFASAEERLDALEAAQEASDIRFADEVGHQRVGMTILAADTESALLRTAALAVEVSDLREENAKILDEATSMISRLEELEKRAPIREAGTQVSYGHHAVYREDEGAPPSPPRYPITEVSQTTAGDPAVAAAVLAAATGVGIAEDDTEPLGDQADLPLVSLVEMVESLTHDLGLPLQAPDLTTSPGSGVVSGGLVQQVQLCCALLGVPTQGAIVDQVNACFTVLYGESLSERMIDRRVKMSSDEEEAQAAEMEPESPKEPPRRSSLSHWMPNEQAALHATRSPVPPKPYEPHWRPP